MNFIVTGANGFIGKAFVTYITKSRNHKIYTIKNASEFNQEGLQFFVNLANPNHTKQLIQKLKTKKIDYVFHSAGITPFNNRFDFETDIAMAKNIAMLCNALCIPKLVYISGWIVYDKNSEIPIIETSPLKPYTKYGITKLKIENYFKHTFKETVLINLRLASVFGPGQTPAGLIPNLVKSAIEKNEMIIESPLLRRDYIFIDNVLAAIQQLINQNIRTHIDINIGSGQSYSIISIAKTIQKIFSEQYDIQIKIVNMKKNIDDMLLKDITMDITKSVKFLGRYNTVDLNEGLKKYIEWVK